MIYLKKVLFHHESLWHIKCLKQSIFCGYGNFTQSPGVDYIKYSKVHQFESRALPLYFNLKAKTIRHLELKPIKAYDNLVNTIRQRLLTTLFFIHTGSGYAKGLDIFLRWQNYKI
jgi:hypothetical protein